MPIHIPQATIIDRVRQITVWWVGQRMDKLRSERHVTMSLNPFLAPILFELHHAENFAELGALLLAGHLMTGHSTGFGKLIDEQILPKVFGTHKLSAIYRRTHPPFIASYFNEIDHLVPNPEGKPVLISLKTSRWTIQLTAATELNNAFVKILEQHPDMFDEIIVGVSVGTQEGLSDKYDILRGINRGKKHDVMDIQAHVRVLAGKDFWTWMNDGEPATQSWMLEGILQGLQDTNCREACRQLLASYTAAFNRRYESYTNSDGTINWHKLLSDVNG